MAASGSHYDVLGVSPDATSVEIKRAYRALVVRLHPDKARGSAVDPAPASKPGESIEEIATRTPAIAAIGGGESDLEGRVSPSSDEHSGQARSGRDASPTARAEPADPSPFQRLQTAYNTLRDPVKRRSYDDELRRSRERTEWRARGAVEVDLSEMESDLCEIVDDDSDDCSDIDERRDEAQNGVNLQRVYFHPCRCGETFEICQDELTERRDRGDVLVWQCEGCSLSIFVRIDDAVE
ncbi:hypothetical protein THAOC_03861 [Thalassiosira oceanica]|uniref:Diphthamide biosynthesis protein 4 n=1 Tax=Thalassiosira oceanica TaxID=159749 RepID=K0TBE6_THAOC|nr:hypothetical protein THAOC_03861 [Thalassiosira oceanica]|mmetsp:Transcript_34352/g.82157  ORF Transcript_34352/g.82157 Transcript_34352/m.82157 type:complete len:238 (-) Transcript_34352:507-1220(-)|eukprot:EJK74459.1 hypothetical protein THAOC_03861 [Thalassiosira oceanica]